jgi:hypothetical protein
MMISRKRFLDIEDTSNQCTVTTYNTFRFRSDQPSGMRELAEERRRRGSEIGNSSTIGLKIKRVDGRSYLFVSDTISCLKHLYPAARRDIPLPAIYLTIVFSNFCRNPSGNKTLPSVYCTRTTPCPDDAFPLQLMPGLPLKWAFQPY